MFIEKFGEDLKIAKQSTLLDSSNNALTQSASGHIATSEVIIPQLIYINDSFEALEPAYNPLVASYNTELDHISKNIVNRVGVNYNIPGNGLINEIIALRVTMPKSEGTRIFLTMGFGYASSQPAGNRHFSLYFDVGNGWQSWFGFIYNQTDFVEFERISIRISGIPKNDSFQCKIGVEPSIADPGSLRNIDFTMYEIPRS
jgi:hypothetical protein